MASVSVGKPAMRSAPNAMSGRSRRTAAQNATASARRCRRFMRFRIRSEPCCSDRCRCGMNRGSAATTSRRSRIGLDAVERGQPQAGQLGHFAQHALQQRAEARAVGRRVGRDVDARQHDLGGAASTRPRTSSTTRSGGGRARRAAPEGDDAEGAAVVAAVLDLDEAARVPPASPWAEGGCGARGRGATARPRPGRRRGLGRVGEHASTSGHGGEAGGRPRRRSPSPRSRRRGERARRGGRPGAPGAPPRR